MALEIRARGRQHLEKDSGSEIRVWGTIGLSPWQAIVKMFDDFKEAFRWAMGNGKMIAFWEDKWSGNYPSSWNF